MANKEENRELDVRRLRERGIPVWVTDIETVPASITSMRRSLREVLEGGGPRLAEGGPGLEWPGARPERPGRRADLA